MIITQNHLLNSKLNLVNKFSKIKQQQIVKCSRRLRIRTGIDLIEIK